MWTKYSVVQYLPHPLSGEAINLGIVAWSEDQVACRFRKDWRRVHNFGRENLDLVKEFVARVESAVNRGPTLVGIGDSLGARVLEKIADSWTRSIQLSDPKVSLKPANEILAELAPIFMPGEPRAHAAPRTRKAARRIAQREIKAALNSARFARLEAKCNQELSGKLEAHVFDVVVENSRPFLAAHGLSFEVETGPRLNRQIDAAKWAVDDIMNKQPSLPIGILALPPRNGDSDVYANARRVFSKLGAVFVSEGDLGGWAALHLHAIT